MSTTLATREFDFTDADFERVRKLIYAQAGISLSPAKRDMVYSRLARRLRARGDSSFGQYLRRLEGGDNTEWEPFVNALTTNLTSFFRESHHFDILGQWVRQLKERRPVRIWSSACSTGEEAYSIAISMCEVFDTLTPPVQIMASDLDTNVLAKAQSGVYEEERVEKLSRERLQRFFQRGTGANSGQVRVRPELTRLITFHQANLLHNRWPVQGPLDIIFCRNVMIYFDKPTQYAILKKMKPLLKPDGLLFVGHSEALYHATDLFNLRGQTVYEHAERKAVK